MVKQTRRERNRTTDHDDHDPCGVSWRMLALGDACCRASRLRGRRRPLIIRWIRSPSRRNATCSQQHQRSLALSLRSRNLPRHHRSTLPPPPTGRASSSTSSPSLPQPRPRRLLALKLSPNALKRSRAPSWALQLGRLSRTPPTSHTPRGTPASPPSPIAFFD